FFFIQPFYTHRQPCAIPQSPPTPTRLRRSGGIYRFARKQLGPRKNKEARTSRTSLPGLRVSTLSANHHGARVASLRSPILRAVPNVSAKLSCESMRKMPAAEREARFGVTPFSVKEGA